MRRLVRAGGDFINGLPGSENVKVFVASTAIIGFCSYQVLGSEWWT